MKNYSAVVDKSKQIQAELEYDAWRPYILTLTHVTGVDFSFHGPRITVNINDCNDAERQILVKHIESLVSSHIFVSTPTKIWISTPRPNASGV